MRGGTQIPSLMEKTLKALPKSVLEQIADIDQDTHYKDYAMIEKFRRKISRRNVARKFSRNVRNIKGTYHYKIFKLMALFLTKMLEPSILAYKLRRPKANINNLCCDNWLTFLYYTKRDYKGNNKPGYNELHNKYPQTEDEEADGMEVNKEALALFLTHRLGFFKMVSNIDEGKAIYKYKVPDYNKKLKFIFDQDTECEEIIKPGSGVSMQRLFASSSSSLNKKSISSSKRSGSLSSSSKRSRTSLSAKKLLIEEGEWVKIIDRSKDDYWIGKVIQSDHNNINNKYFKIPPSSLRMRNLFPEWNASIPVDIKGKKPGEIIEIESNIFDIVKSKLISCVDDYESDDDDIKHIENDYTDEFFDKDIDNEDRVEILRNALDFKPDVALEISLINLYEAILKVVHLICMVGDLFFRNNFKIFGF